MKIFPTLLLATLALAAFATETTDAVNVRQVVRKQVQQSRAAASFKLVANDLNEGPGNDNVNNEAPFGTTLAFDESPSTEPAPPTTNEPAVPTTSNNTTPPTNSTAVPLADSIAGSGGDDAGSGVNDSSNDGSGDDRNDGSGEGNGEGSGEGSGSGPDPVTVGPRKNRHEHTMALQPEEGDDWALFDLGLESASNTGDASSSGSNIDAEPPSNAPLTLTPGSGSDADTGSGSDADTGSGSDADSDSDGSNGSNDASTDGDGVDSDGKPANNPGAEALDTLVAGVELAARVSADATSFDLRGSKTLLLGGSIVGAAVGVLAAVLGVVHLRRQQHHDEQSTLAAELPEPQTGRADGEFEEEGTPVEDELAASSIDLEEALNKEDEEEKDDDEDEEEEEEEKESEGAFANDSVV